MRIALTATQTHYNNCSVPIFPDLKLSALYKFYLFIPTPGGGDAHTDVMTARTPRPKVK